MSKQKPWNLELFRAFDDNFSEDHLLINAPIRNFLEDEYIFFLSGAKGLGKTLFLRYKSLLYHRRFGHSVKFNVSQTELTENLRLPAQYLSYKDLDRFRTVQQWSELWELSFYTVVFRLFGLTLPKPIERILPLDSNTDVSIAISCLLNHRNRVREYRDALLEFQGRRNEVQSAVILFIDDVDQALHELLSNFPKEPSQDYQPVTDVWVNAQMGLVKAVYTLSRLNAHIKIYGTIRREAWEAFQDPMALNYRRYIAVLEYTKEEVQEIFIKNIYLTPPQKMPKLNASNPVERFIGFTEIPHRFAKMPNGEPRREKVLDFIYRHTYGRPREIVLMGQKIEDLVSATHYKEATEEQRFLLLRQVVNKIGGEIFAQYREEIIPYFDEAELNDLIRRIGRNVIFREHFNSLGETLLRRYLNFGLLGYVHQGDLQGGLVQRFLPPATYNCHRLRPLPNTEYLLVHSTLDSLMLEHHALGTFYDERNIIGDRYPFVPVEQAPQYILEYYLPKGVSGNRWGAGSENGGHPEYGLEEVYCTFFNFHEKPHQFVERFHSEFRKAHELLTLLGRLCSCHLLYRRLHRTEYREQKERCIKEISRYQVVRPYQARFNGLNEEITLTRFLDRLIGRFVTLGALLVLDLHLEWIHDLLTQGQFEFTPHDKHRANALTYLSRAFYIKGLSQNEPRCPDRPEHLRTKEEIFSHLSPFEQDELRRFAKDVVEETLHLNWLDKAAAEWLDQNVLKRVWTPPGR
ncbi:MAG: hypothetical protein RMJ33_10000 [Saprospiraceae bacterium]|nr:hypothetical protein [Saprospiraceae bacterium]MDW8230157.1 hypothetical protein [Saprospiraceae bacterium]